jgi:hypothetical protein
VSVAVIELEDAATKSLPADELEVMARRRRIV